MVGIRVASGLKSADMNVKKTMSTRLAFEFRACSKKKRTVGVIGN